MLGTWCHDDLKNAYRVLPVHADDHPLLAIRWGPKVYPDTALPFGLLADALAWVMFRHGIHHQLHYLDDFLFVGAPASLKCSTSLQFALQLCDNLGVPVAAHKTEGPATRVTFLGIQIDSVAMQLSLASDKLTRIRALVLSWRSRRAATKKELPIIDWPPQPCSHGCPAWTHFHASHVRFGEAS